MVDLMKNANNGAEVFRINYAADLSSKGLLRSFGVKVNYRYQLDQIESNVCPAGKL